MSFIHNIQSVARYESKILIRSWFFKVFTVLAVFILGMANFSMLVADGSGYFWMGKAIASNIPYINILLLNTGQAVIAIFLASEFLKRDKKLDTSEVFYVRPLSNAEYVVGKIWGNLRVFLVLNLIIMVEAMIFTLMSPGASIDGLSYLVYFVLISIPTLIFIIGLSIFLMLVFKNQALTFIILLGYIGLTLFYIADKFYYVFDYMTYNLPLFRSTIVGFTNWDLLLNHRAIYFFAGLAFIFFTVSLFKRLPNSSRSSYPWIALSGIMLLLSVSAGYRHVQAILQVQKMRKVYVDINNKYVGMPKMVIDRYDISVEQQPGTFSSVAKIQGVPLQTSSVFTFCLNPGLQVREILWGDRKLSFERDLQIIRVDFGKEIAAGDTVCLSFAYGGRLQRDFCYLDIPEEVLREPYKMEMVNIDKQYVFQTPDYLLFTPETYWYPRPGTSYSDADPSWLQTYFSRFKLEVKPLPGLVPISQGDAEEKEGGTYSFAPGYPVQAISLAVGNYRQKSVEADSTRYNVWYIEGNDYFTSLFDSIQDTIPSLINNVRENFERTYKLTYPFDRFSIVEVPAQFSSYTRSWSQAQETVQPEMVFFPEKGCTSYQMDLERQKQNQFQWAKWNGREITNEEAEIRVLNGVLNTFTRSEGSYNYSSGGRGQFNVERTENPYFIFPQIYNFRYNIFSPEWPIANRMVELYLQKRKDNSWEREINGISNNEKANLLMKEKSFKTLLGDVEHRDLLNNIIGLKGNWLFAAPEIRMGIQAFRDTVYQVLERNTFRNVQFEHLLDTLGRISGTDLVSQIADWDRPASLPYYTIGRPEVTKIRNRSEEVFRLQLIVSNNSDYDGMINLTINVGRRDALEQDPRTNRKVFLPAHEARLLVSLWDEAPRDVTVNTLLSDNLPNEINLPIGVVNEERNRDPGKEEDVVLPESTLLEKNEVVVDNEDSLFSLSAPAIVGLLPKWLDKVGDTSFKYVGVSSWRAPLQWTATTHAAYYGRYVRSAYVIKSGDGSQTATWKVPVPAEGQYELYYYVSKNDELKYNKNAEGEYHFKVLYGPETEDVYLDLKRAKEGWEQVGVYYFSSDTIRVVLTNECRLRSVTADAVKIVKR